MKNILVAVDFSTITSDLIDKAAEMALCHRSKSHVYIVHVASPNPDFIGNKIGPANERQSRASELRKEKKELEQLTENLKRLEVEATPLLIQGPTAELLLTEARRLRAKYLIMGTHGYGVALTALLGSTSHMVIRDTPCPVLLVPYCNDKQDVLTKY